MAKEKAKAGAKQPASGKPQPASGSREPAADEPGLGIRAMETQNPEPENSRRTLLSWLSSRTDAASSNLVPPGSQPNVQSPASRNPESGTSASAASPPDSPKSGTVAKPKKPEQPDNVKVFMTRLYRRISAAMPRTFIAHFERKMKFAGITPEAAAIHLGRAMLISIICGTLPLMLYLAAYNPIATTLTASIAAGLFFGGMVLSVVLFYLKLYFRITDRAAFVERVLPDFLSLTVSNLRAGMSPYAAFVHAARPEFGAFHEAVTLAMARMGGRVSVADSLVEAADSFDSPILRRTVTLFAKGMRSGGQLVRLLNSSAEEVRRIQDLRAELVTSTRTYSIFLGFIVVAVMPFLLAVSANFVSVFVSLQVDTSGIETGSASIPSFTGKILITPADMYNISIITLLVTDILVAVLMGVVDRGKAIYGVKSFPILAVLSMVAFVVAKSVISSFLSSFML